MVEIESGIARSLEKLARDEKDLKKSALYWESAADIHKKLGNEKDYLYCSANQKYREARVAYHLYKDYKTAKELYSRAREMFAKRNLKDMAFVCGCLMYRCSLRLIERKIDPENPLFDEINRFLELNKGLMISKELRDRAEWLKLRSLSTRARVLMKVKDVNSLSKAIKLFDEAIAIKGEEYNKIWKYRSLAHLEKIKRGDFLKIAEYYQKAGHSHEKRYESDMVEDYIDACKYRALFAKETDNHEKFFEEVKNAEEWLSKLEDTKHRDKTRLYFKALEEEIRGKRNLYKKEYEKSLVHYEFAKECYYKTGDSSSGFGCELKINLINGILQELDGDMSAAVGFFKNAVKTMEKIGLETFYIRFKYLVCKGKLYLQDRQYGAAKQSFSEAFESAKAFYRKKSQMWVEEVMNFCTYLEGLKSARESLRDIQLEVSAHLATIYRERLGVRLFDAYNGVVALYGLKINNILTKTLEENLTKQAINCIVRPVKKVELELLFREIELRSRFSAMGWTLVYPPLILEEFGRAETEPFVISEEYLDHCVEDYLKSLELSLQIVVEFNSKVQWGKEWESELKKMVKKEKKFSSFTLGDLKHSLIELAKHENNFCNKLIGQKGLENLLNKLMELRPTHEAGTLVRFDEKKLGTVKNGVINVLKELGVCMPILVSVVSKSKIEHGEKLKYKVKLWWSLPEKFAFIENPKEFNKGEIYYIDPLSIPNEKFIIKSQNMVNCENKNLIKRHPTLA